MTDFPLQGLPFQKVKHQVSTLDAQPTLNEGVLILVTGQLLVRARAITPLPPYYFCS